MHTVPWVNTSKRTNLVTFFQSMVSFLWLYRSLLISIRNSSKGSNYNFWLGYFHFAAANLNRVSINQNQLDFLNEHNSSNLKTSPYCNKNLMPDCHHHHRSWLLHWKTHCNSRTSLIQLRNLISRGPTSSSTTTSVYLYWRTWTVQLSWELSPKSSEITWKLRYINFQKPSSNVYFSLTVATWNSMG